jgi:two-component system, response regulator YesN
VPYRVLVADDEEFERRALRLILGAEGMPELEIVEASNGLEALGLVGDAGLDAAFLDIRMPGLDGIETARELRRARPLLPIVFLTAHDTFEYARSALRLRVEDFLLKPASPEEVAAALKRALSASEEGQRDAGARAADARAAGAAASAKIEGAAAFIAEELRSGLGAGAVPEDLLSRYLSLSGRDEGVAAAVCLRSGAGGARGPSSAKSAAGLAERVLSADGRIALAGSGVEEALCVVAGGPRGEGAGDWLLPGLEEIVSKAMEDLGLRLAVGAAFPAGPGEPRSGELARTARRAAALAGEGRPIVALPLFSAPAEPRPRERESAPGGAPAASSPAGRRVAALALELLEERHSEDLSLESVASELGVSPSHLSRVLARHAGMGFADCLARMRVERAKSFLAAPAVSVKEAAAMVGFRDPAYFARVFRRFEGESPAEFRSRSLGGEREVK